MKLHFIFGGMQSTMEKGFQSLQSRLSDVEKRMDCFEEKLNSGHTEPINIPTGNMESTCSRKNPPELQVYTCTCTLYTVTAYSNYVASSSNDSFFV